MKVIYGRVRAVLDSPRGVEVSDPLVSPQTGKPYIDDLFSDLCDGRRLLDLLAGLSGEELAKERGFSRVHALNNVNRALQFLQKNNVELVNIGGVDIVDGNHKLTLGLIWSIILHWQVKDVMKDLMEGLQQTSSEKILLSWVRQSTRDYKPVNVVNFSSSWSDGLAFNALIHSHRPELFEWKGVEKQTAIERLDHAFSLAKQQLGIVQLLDPEDVAISNPDKKSIMMYVTSLFQVLPQGVSIEAIQEVETLPASRAAQGPGPGAVTGAARGAEIVRGAMREEHVEVHKQQRFSQQITVSVAQGRLYLHTGSLCHVPRTKEKALHFKVSGQPGRGGPSRQPPARGNPLLEGYQSALEQVLTWLLSAEDGLQAQPPISGRVDEVKEQFHTHEGYMVELTSQQGSVGRVLQMGNTLLSEGRLTEEEESEVREQMNLLNSRWEHLRVASMERQSKLHEALMDLQHQQLKQLTDWLELTEARIKRMEAEPLGPDLEDVKHQVEEHKLLQEDLESEQVRVNSLTHMVVVVDENSGDSATAVLEEKLQHLGDRWAAICKWTEERWVLLQEILLKWQHFTEEQFLFDSWLVEKEELVRSIQSSDFKDQNEMVASLKKLAVVKADLEMKRQTMDRLCALSQDLLSSVKNKELAHKLEARLENLAQRWDTLVHLLEENSSQISLTVTASPAEQTHTATVTSAVTKKRQIVVDSELRKRFDVDFTELHSFMTRSEATLQSPEFSERGKEGSVTELRDRVLAIDREKPEKQRKLQEATRSAQALVDQLASDGQRADDIQQAAEQLNSRWVEFCALLEDRLSWLAYQTKVLAFYSQFQQLEQAVLTAENWLKDELGRLSALQPQVERLKEQVNELREKEEAAPVVLDADITAFTQHYREVLAELRARERQLLQVQDSLPPLRYKETVASLLSWLQQCEAQLSVPSAAVTVYPVMEQRLKDIQAMQAGLQEHQAELDYLTVTMEQVCQKAPPEVGHRFRAELEPLMLRWRKLSELLTERAHTLQGQMDKLQQFQNDTKTLRKWMAEVDVFLNEEWPALGDSEALEKQLEQCTALLVKPRLLCDPPLLVCVCNPIQPSLNGINPRPWAWRPA
ncbi:hypothetical protein COCON_G00200700 [Conger conger]|uniref:Calponin-homology (CH) domain-containing protein n=1 Tax=Conger conger TaxID=82655 RepID=A0A9Q1D1Q6_CONCO|nr:hypothetical protein COCON_G00200700 [Conger conger]